MKQSTFSAVMANSIKNLLQGYTKSIRFVAVLTMLLTLGIGQAWGAESVTYTVTSTSAVTESGTAPEGSSATYTSTYTNAKCQLTANNSMTLTLSGYDGCEITDLTLSMKSNKSGGAGNMSMKIGTSTVSSIETAAFNSSTWYGNYSQSYVDVNPSVTATTVGNGEEIVITIAATVNSLYCQSFTLTYTAASSGGEGGGDSGGGDEGGCTWELVTDVSSLAAGDVLVITSNTNAAVAGDITSQYMSKIGDITFSNDKSTITTLPANAVQLTLGGSSGAWTLANSDGNLLGATAVKKVAWDSGTTTWSISISDNNATIQNSTSSYGRFLYNTDNPRFTTYTSDASASMLLPQIYKEVCEEETCSLTAVDITQDATINITQGEAFHLKAVAMGDVVDVAEYIWEKKTGSSPDVWTVITDEDGDKTTLSYDPCTVENGGIYRCTIKNSEDCQATSNPFTVKVYNLRGINDDWDTPIPFVWNEVDNSYTATLQLDLQPNKLYEFKVNDGTDWYSDNSAGTMIVTNSSNWTMVQNSTAGNTKILTTVGGTYTFTLNYIDASNPKLSVTYPTQETVVYLTPNSNWTQASAYFCVYYFKSSNDNDNGWVKMTKDACNQYTASIPAGYNKMIFVRANPEKTTLSWACAWDQTNDLDVPTSANILYTVADGAWSKGDGAWSEYSPYHTITYDMNGHGSMDPNYVCVGVGYDWSTPTNPSVSGYTFLGWKRDDSTGDSNLYKNGTAYTTFTPTSSETLTAQWETQSHQILYFDGGATTGIVFSGVHEEGYPTSFLHGVGVQLKGATKAHYSFGGWYGNTACTVGPKTEITASAAIADISLYAKWTINQYTVTLNPNYPNGKTGTFTYDAGELVDGNLVLTYDYNTASMTIEDLYTSLTLDGYEFGGWYNAKGVNPGEVSGAPCTTTGTITGNKTYFAKWSKLYTITLSENGKTTELDAQTSTSYTLPETLTAGSCDNDEKELVGWSTVAIPNPGDKPTSNFYELGATVTLTADQTTFYAVFATGTTTDEIITTEETAMLSFDDTSKRTVFNEDQQVWEQNGIVFTNNKAESSNDIANYINPVRCYKDSKIIIDCNALGNITKVLFKCSSSDSADDLELSIGPEAISDGTWVTLTPKSKPKIYEITLAEGQTRIYTLTVTYEKISDNASSVSYSDYTTICEAIPDPVWGGAVINRNSIQVDCGSMTTLNAAEPNGPATISFPAATNHTLTYDITVTASEGFLVSTNKTDATKYGASVTVSPNKTGDNAGKITQNVYVVAVAPAMSDEDFTGTITLSGKQLAEPQVIDVTANVTCTQYTLTLVDRGVSTEQPTKYYAGETINEAPADPEGVCTDPIHYVFDGWAEAAVAEGSTTYTKVTFPYTVTGNTKFYAVYRYVEDGGADSGDYVKVTENLDDYSGDYLFVYETGNVAFDGGLDELDETENTIAVTISNNTIESNATTDAAKFIIAKVDGGYSIQSASGYFIGWSTADKNGLNANSKYSANYYLNTISNSIISGVKGTLKFNKTSGQERFRYYQSGQETIALYRKATSYLYTTSPICGPHLAITEGKDIYVTGGNAGGTRDLVIAQQKVSYKATRLQTSNGLDDGTAPDVKVATNGITVGGVVTSDVKVTIDQTKEQQTDGTYTITGTITVQYQPSANNKQEDIQVQLAVDYNAEARDNFIVHARSLPAEFVIVAKSGDKWYALNGDMNTNAANPANGKVTLDDDANPTKATYAPCNTIYTFDGVPNTGDRTYVRFQGTDGAWLWASSGTNVGIQNNVLKTTPEGNNNAYNWKLYTEDNITYRFGNANSSRQLTLSGEKKFGMYASGVQDIRILPYEAKCLYNYAPTNLKVSVLKGTYVTLTWDAVAGATKYQYSTNGTTWTDCGTEPTVTINGLTGATEYTYYIRAYHADAGVSQECIDYAEITFTTANCDDVPADITYSADLTSITVTWTAVSTNCTVRLYSDEACTSVVKFADELNGSVTFSQLDRNTTYYVRVFADGTCASPIVPVKTEDVEVDIVEWQPQGIIVDINTDETIGVTLENEVSYGSGIGTEATELFFSKYYEASYNVKLVAIYNGTKNIIDLTDYTIQYGKTSWENNFITLKDFGATKGQIQPGEEIILYSMQEGTEDDDIMDCVYEDFPDGNWVRVTSTNNDGNGTLSFGGDKTIILCKTEYDDEEDKYYDYIIDVIGALKNDPNEGILPTNENTEEPSWGDKEGWVCETGLSIADDSQIGISTNRCLLIRNNTVTSGENAVAQNIGDFVTLCSEWKGAQVPDNKVDNGVQASCDNFAYVGTFDYSDYYTKYVSMGDEQEFDENARNADGTVTIEIADLYKHACSNIRVKLTNSNGDVLTDREYKVPIMITSTQGTNGQTFLDLQENLATVEVDGNGNPTGHKTNLTLEQVREICKTCDVVVRDNAILTKVTDGTTNDHPQVHDVIVYEGASIVIPDGEDHNYTINSLSLRRKGDTVASAQVQGTGKFVLPADAPVTLSMRINANNWHWFTLPYDCDIADVTWSDGTPAKYNTDWFLMYYDGESRAASTNPYDNHWKVYGGTTIEAGKGYILGITGNLAHPKYTFELHFPMEQGVLTAEKDDKTVAVNAWGVKSDNTPNNLGWNLVGNPYLNYYKTADEYSLAGLPLIHYINTDPVTGKWNYENSGSVPYVVTPVDGGWYEYKQDLASEVNMMPFTAYFVQVGDPDTHTDGQALNASFEASNRGKKSILRRAQSEVDDLEEPAIVAVSLTNAKGESDKTTLIIDDRFTNEYEMNADFFKWFGDYYKYYTKPVLYSVGADAGKRAFNALSEQLAAQPIPLGMFAAQAGDYTFTLTRKRCDLSRVEEVWLYDATTATYTNLMQQDYTFTTAKTEGEGRFYLSVKMKQKTPTAVENVNGNLSLVANQQTLVLSGLPAEAQVWVYDATGKLLHSEHTTAYQRIYPVQQAGVYFVSVKGQGDAQTLSTIVK